MNSGMRKYFDPQRYHTYNDHSDANIELLREGLNVVYPDLYKHITSDQRNWDQVINLVLEVFTDSMFSKWDRISDALCVGGFIEFIPLLLALIKMNMAKFKQSGVTLRSPCTPKTISMVFQVGADIDQEDLLQEAEVIRSLLQK
jgi:hypothetical protein